MIEQQIFDGLNAFMMGTERKQTQIDNDCKGVSIATIYMPDSKFSVFTVHSVLHQYLSLHTILLIIHFKDYAFGLSSNKSLNSSRKQMLYTNKY